MRQTYVNHALRAPRLSQGVSSAALGYIWGPFAFIAFMIGSSVGWLWAIGPVACGVLVHSVVKWMYRKDHRYFAIEAKWTKLAEEYHPHSREKLPAPFERPAKMGHGVRF